MSSKIDLDDNDAVCTKDCVVHSMPCKINYDGSANVTGFFSPYIEKKDPPEKSILEASFRGYPLDGQIITIPEDYKGIISEVNNPSKENEQKVLTVRKQFKSVTYWNWDYLPTNNDSLHQAIDWLTLSNVIHQID